MANTADIRMNNFTPATDVDYFYVELADGSQGKIKKTDVINLLKKAFTYVDEMTWDRDVNVCNRTGVFRIIQGASNGPAGTPMGSFLLNFYWNSEAQKQLFFLYGSESIYKRSMISGVWGAWNSI